jgi:hypothetical protein
MAGRAKIESLSVIPDGLLQILDLSQLPEASGNGTGEVIERFRMSWVARRAKNESLSVIPDGLLQILHLS